MSDFIFSVAEIVAQIRSEIRINAEGQGFASLRAVARLAGVEHSSLVRQFEGGALGLSKLLELLAAAGFEGGALQPWTETGVPDMAIAVILEYYAFDAGRYCSVQAKAVYRVFSSIGIRTWMQKESGWQSSLESSVVPRITPDQAIAHQFEQDSFNPFAAANPIAAQVFLGWQGLNAVVQIAAAQQVEQIESTTIALPDPKLLETLNGAFLNLNRSGLAMNKLFKFIDRIPTMQRLDSSELDQMAEALLEAGRSIGELQKRLKVSEKMLVDQQISHDQDLAELETKQNMLKFWAALERSKKDQSKFQGENNRLKKENNELRKQLSPTHPQLRAAN